VNAIILAAGRGTRLGLGDGPKCLAPIGAKTILTRSLDALDRLGVPVTIVVGHSASHIETHVARRERKATVVRNNRYREGSILSLEVGLAAIGSPTDVLLMDGDVVCDPELLSRLIEAKAADALLVDVGAQFTDEQFMAGMRRDRVVTLRRGPVPGHDEQGEWIGFTKLSAQAVTRFRSAIAAQIARGETAGGYEDALGEILGDIPITCVPTDGLPWVEIDFREDLTRARTLFAAVP
jgi:choline kinase